jgi:hypothetical protein
VKVNTSAPPIKHSTFLSSQRVSPAATQVNYALNIFLRLSMKEMILFPCYFKKQTFYGALSRKNMFLT